MATTKNDDVDVLKKDIEDLKSAVKTLTDDLRAAAESNAKSAGERAGDRLDDIRKDAADVARKAAERGRESAEAVADAVRDRPMQSLLVAFGVGLLLSRLLDRR